LKDKINLSTKLGNASKIRPAPEYVAADVLNNKLNGRIDRLKASKIILQTDRAEVGNKSLNKEYRSTDEIAIENTPSNQRRTEGVR
jgi:hypothetical protein